jgi:hypothetical protein
MNRKKAVMMVVMVVIGRIHSIEERRTQFESEVCDVRKHGWTAAISDLDFGVEWGGRCLSWVTARCAHEARHQNCYLFLTIVHEVSNFAVKEVPESEYRNRNLKIQLNIIIGRQRHASAREGPAPN